MDPGPPGHRHLKHNTAGPACGRHVLGANGRRAVRRPAVRSARTGTVGLGSYLRAGGHEYGRWPEEGHDAVTGTSRGADAGCFYGLNTEQDPWRATTLARRTGGNDNCLLGALRPVDLSPPGYLNVGRRNSLKIPDEGLLGGAVTNAGPAPPTKRRLKPELNRGPVLALATAANSIPNR
jgi:hypothetical protein